MASVAKTMKAIGLSPLFSLSGDILSVSLAVKKPAEGPAPASAMFIDDSTLRPVPQSCQALIRVKAFGLNRMDLMERKGSYPLPPQAPKTMGVEFSGVIVELGDQSSNERKAEEQFQVGDEVFGLAYGGAYAEYIACSTHMLIRKPKELSWTQCAAIPEVWITANQALYQVGEFTKGKSVLWHAGASNVSIAGIQLCHEDGASQVFATVRQDEKVRFCVEELHCDAAFNTTKGDWVKDIKDATDGKGVDLIVDFIGGPMLQSNMDVLARDGRLVCLAAMGGSMTPGPIDMRMVVYKRIRIEGSTLRSRDENYQGRLRDMLVEHALPKFRDGTFKVVVEKEMDWSQIVEAHEMMERNETKGKLVCVIPWE
jgi:NADPH:quinone reductase-like Zn-dependent oxidoreductase